MSRSITGLKVGDNAVRWLAGLPMRVRVTEVTDDLVKCGAWEFDRDTGAEVDADLDWGPPPKHTGSFLTPEKT